MASDIFIKIDGIAGESNDAKHKDEIEVSDWKWSIEQASNMHSGSGGGAGKAAVGDLLFWHQVDRASPNLTKFCLTGNHIAHAKLTVRKAGGSPLEFYKLLCRMSSLLRSIRLVTKRAYSSKLACTLPK